MFHSANVGELNGAVMDNHYKYKHIIWDWNGTVIDDSWLCVEIINKILDVRNIPLINQKIYEEKLIFPAKDFYLSIGINFESEPFSKIANEFASEYNSRFHEASLRQVFLNVMREFCSNERTQHLLSLTEQGSLDKAVDYFGLREYFTSVSGLQHNNADNKNLIANELINRYHIDRSKTILIGDTTHDFEVAIQQGINCVVFPSGFQSLKRLRRLDAIVCTNAFEVLSYL